MPDSVTDILYTVCHLILTTNLWGGCYFYHDVKMRRLGHREIKAVIWVSLGGKGQSWCSNPWCLSSEPLFLTEASHVTPNWAQHLLPLLCFSSWRRVHLTWVNGTHAPKGWHQESHTVFDSFLPLTSIAHPLPNSHIALKIVGLISITSTSPRVQPHLG